jgi:hypothetical protein
MGNLLYSFILEIMAIHIETFSMILFSGRNLSRIISGISRQVL